MITVCPHNSDWDGIAARTGDDSWSAKHMRRYFQRLENKSYRRWERWPKRLTGINLGRHGYEGWLPITTSSPTLLLTSPRLLYLVVKAALWGIYGRATWQGFAVLRGLGVILKLRDINGWRAGAGATGIRLIPVSIMDAKRRGTRERIDHVAKTCPDKLEVVLHALATKILFATENGQTPRAIGVRYARGAHLYGASPQQVRPAQADVVEARCTGEVILSAGAFNISRSKETRVEPDLFCFGIIGHFRGYYPGYSKAATESATFTWAVLKAHTQNRAGSVTLRLADPHARPHIDFRYFYEGSGDHADDLDAVVEGIVTCRRMSEAYGDLVDREIWPGTGVDGEALKTCVKDNAWGHHASCTCPIGSDDDPMAVLDSRFNVRGTKGLRVVDASVFPRIPDFSIVTAIYMVAEKAADVILEDARHIS